MAGKSKTGRGGKSGGKSGGSRPPSSSSLEQRQSSPSVSKHPSSSVSRPVAHRPLPEQYTNTPRSRPETTLPVVQRASPAVQRASPANDDESDDEDEPLLYDDYDEELAADDDEEAADDDEEQTADDVSAPPPLSPEEERLSLQKLLETPGREKYLPVLSILPREHTTWFGRDKGSLTRKITKILKNKYDGKYNSWTKVPLDRQRRYFVEFAQKHTWHPSLTEEVREEFNNVCIDRFKGMMSTVRTTRKRPLWMTESLYKILRKEWNTETFRKRSKTASNSRNSPRNGLGPHKHVSGQKSFSQIQDEMEKELGRPVTIGEVFIKTHTRADGTFVDLRAERVSKNYEKNLQEKLSQNTSDGTDPSQLSPDEANAIFLQSTVLDARGNASGLGSLKRTHVNGNRTDFPGNVATYVAIEEQLKSAKLQIEEQAAENARLDAEFSRHEAETARVIAAQEKKINYLEGIASYLQTKDPNFKSFLASLAPTTSTTEVPEPSPTNSSDHHQV